MPSSFRPRTRGRLQRRALGPGQGRVEWRHAGHVREGCDCRAESQMPRATRTPHRCQASSVALHHPHLRPRAHFPGTGRRARASRCRYVGRIAGRSSGAKRCRANRNAAHFPASFWVVSVPAPVPVDEERRESGRAKARGMHLAYAPSSVRSRPILRGGRRRNPMLPSVPHDARPYLECRGRPFGCELRSTRSDISRTDGIEFLREQPTALHLERTQDAVLTGLNQERDEGGVDIRAASDACRTLVELA